MERTCERTYEADYIADIIEDFALDPMFMAPSLDEVKDILELVDDGEVFLGIVSFIIDNWETAEVLSVDILMKAMEHAQGLLKDFQYASRWLYNWDYRKEAIEEEMRNIHIKLKDSEPFDFSKYQTVDKAALFDLSRWEEFNENHQFYIIYELSKKPKIESIEILKRDIENFSKKDEKDEEAPSRLVLASVALSRLGVGDALEIIFRNFHDSYPWVMNETKEYLYSRLSREGNVKVREKIEDFLESL